MYFHLIGIKEKNGEKHSLDFIIQGGDENFIRDFLANQGVVIVSITEFKEDPKSFGNIRILVQHKSTEIEIISTGDKLEEKAHLFISLGFNPHFLNYIDNPIQEDEMQKLLHSSFQEIEQKNKQFEQQKLEEETKEKKKYEESAVNDSINIINANIDRIEHVIKAGEGVLSGIDVKKLNDFANEMKKIRLGTNFNKMASLVLESHGIVSDAEKKILEAYDSQKVIIDQNSSITNIDVIYNLLKINEIKEKGAFQPGELSTIESLDNMLGINGVFFKLLRKDFSFIIGKTSVNDFFEILIGLIEDIVDIIILIISLTRLVAFLLGIDKFSLYLLPAIGRLGLLLYLYNNLKIKGLIGKLVGFVIMAGVYRYGLTLLLNTFAL